MRIVCFEDAEALEWYGTLSEDGKKIEVIDFFFDEMNQTGDFLDTDSVKLTSPVDPPDILAIGLNYRKHAMESKMKIPEEPVLFIKAASSTTGPDTDIILPKAAPKEVDFEAELAIIIKETCRNVSEDEALDYVLGYTCANDISARDLQLRKDKQWARAKSFDTFCPLGPWIETDLNPDNLVIRSKLNGEIMQESNTSDMIFSCREIISQLSSWMTLYPGTVILTGTPEGVGFARKPPVFLKPGDCIEVEIEGIGTLKNTVVAGQE